MLLRRCADGVLIARAVGPPRPETEKSLVILFFDSEDDYQRGDETLSAMPTSETPGHRTAVAKYQVAFRMTD